VPEPRLSDQETTGTSNSSHRPLNQHPTKYAIRRKGSRYNIFGPEGRVFTKYQSARIAGPRWEELTHTPWPHQSSAYQPGMRLWQLGLIHRQDVGKTRVTTKHKADTRKQQPGETTSPARQPHAANRQDKVWVVLEPKRVPVSAVLPVDTPLALPAPRIDVKKQDQMIRALRHNPKLLFNPAIRQALQREVEYHRPYARWAQKLLQLLARYEARQRHRQQRTSPAADAILAKHIAWQEQQMEEKTVASTT